MRLIQDDGHGDFSLVEHTDDHLPRYAILSHTWGADNEEVTFKDLMQGAGKSKVGYKKVEFCGNQAAHDGLRHFWVDTCCIDKASSAELTEAINSMFRWYRHAAKCYVYLSDVSANDHNQDSLSFQSWEAGFRNSRWFTRGWTLQELIAPPLVEFFSLEGKRLGDKKSLERQVHEVTEVAVRALQGDKLLEFSVAERMSWAEKRETRREEDKAYSMLGIFSVHLPLIYGEGKENALRRLRQEIDSRLLPKETSTQRALQLPQPSPSTPSIIIPFRRDRDFIERLILGDILRRAAEPGARIGLVGLGGVGKSQLAIEYAYRVREINSQTWVFWVHASSTTRFEESYRNIAAHLRLTGWNEPKADVLGMVHGWLSDETNGQWTMVVDNADNLDVLFEPWNRGTGTNIIAVSADHSLSEYLPFSPNGSIVITSRSQEVVQRLQVFGEDMLDVGPMEMDKAKSLLLKKLKKAEPGANPDDIVRLIKQLDCMPLTITQAAAYIDQSTPRITVSRYMELLENDDRERAALLQKDLRDPRRDRQASNSIIFTLHVTFKYLRQAQKSAARLLALMSMFDREAIPDHLLRGKYMDVQDSKTDFEDDIMTLRAYSLIGVDISGNMFDMHRLVQLSIKAWLEIQDDLRSWQERYIDILGAAFPEGNYANWATCQALLPHVEAMEIHQVGSTDHLRVRAQVLFNGAWYAIERGQYGPAEKMARASLEVRQEVLDHNNTAILNSISMLALVLGHRGQYKQAEEMNRRALAGYEKELGVNHPDTLTNVSNLASILQYQGQYKQAEEMNRRALAGREKELGVNHPDTLTSVSNLALILQYQGQYRQAEEMSRRVLAAREKELGVNHPNTLTSVYCLAQLLSASQDYNEALNLYHRAIVGYEKLLGPEHPTTVACQKQRALLIEKNPSAPTVMAIQLFSDS